MAVYHLSMSKIQRSAGRSAVAASAYRSAEEYTDLRTGEQHDYTRKRGVESSAIIVPKDAPEWAQNRGQLWNVAEAAENRKNSVTAREITIALPHEISAEARDGVAHAFARHLVERYGVAVDVNIHGPGRGGDERNYHAHLLFTTRRLGPDGFGEKTRVLDDKKTGPEEVEHLRAQWELLANRALHSAGSESRIDHRTLTEQGIEDRLPTRHLGPAATAMERRGIRTERGRWNRRVAALRKSLSRAKKQEAEARKLLGPAVVESALRQAQGSVQRDFQKGARAVGNLLNGGKREIHAAPEEQKAQGLAGAARRRDESRGAGGSAPSIATEGSGAAVHAGLARPSHWTDLGEAHPTRSAVSATQAQELETQRKNTATQPEGAATQPKTAATQPKTAATQNGKGEERPGVWWHDANTGRYGFKPAVWEHGEGISILEQGSFAMRPTRDGQTELLTRQKDARGVAVWKPAKKPYVGHAVEVMRVAEGRQSYINSVNAGMTPLPGYMPSQDAQGRPIGVHPEGFFAVRPENPGKPGQLELLARVKDSGTGREAWRETGFKAAPEAVYVELGRQMELVKPGMERTSARNAEYWKAGRSTAPAPRQSESLLDQVKRLDREASRLPRAERNAALVEIKKLEEKLTPAERYSLKKSRERISGRER